MNGGPKAILSLERVFGGPGFRLSGTKAFSYSGIGVDVAGFRFQSGIRACNVDFLGSLS